MAGNLNRKEEIAANPQWPVHIIWTYFSFTKDYGPKTEVTPDVGEPKCDWAMAVSDDPTQYHAKSCNKLAHAHFPSSMVLVPILSTTGCKYILDIDGKSKKHRWRKPWWTSLSITCFDVIHNWMNTVPQICESTACFSKTIIIYHVVVVYHQCEIERVFFPKEIRMNTEKSHQLQILQRGIRSTELLPIFWQTDTRAKTSLKVNCINKTKN